MFNGFSETMIDADDLRLLVRFAGDGPAVLLLHGHPRTSATWHRVAPALLDHGFTVVCADLPGYGRSDKPAPTADHAAHSKRAGARRLVHAMHELGNDRFSVVGHDRGSYYALRMALDHADSITKVALLDCLPISEHPRPRGRPLRHCVVALVLLRPAGHPRASHRRRPRRLVPRGPRVHGS